MEIRELSIKGAFEITPKQHDDSRGTFLELFKRDAFIDAVGHPLKLAQANCSVSAKGVLRGLHFANVPPSQAKYVTCFSGAVLDVVVDFRVGSPTFKQWDSVVLDTVERRAIYIAEGLGHAFLALEDNSTVMYMCSEGYAPGREHAVHPLDPELNIEWPDIELVMSEKDKVAPSFKQQFEAGLMPTIEECEAFYATLKQR